MANCPSLSRRQTKSKARLHLFLVPAYVLHRSHADAIAI
jgi:hypothetical protein